MSEVAAWACQPMIVAVRSAGGAPQALVEGLPVSLPELARRSTRLRWDHYTVIVERAAELLGGPEAIEEVASRFGLDRSSGVVAFLAARVVSVRHLYALGARWAGPLAFLSTRAQCEDLPDGRIRQVIEILPPYRDCELFFHGMRGALRTAPGLIGQPEANVEMAIEPRRAVYTITPPPVFWSGRFRRRRASPRVVEAFIAELQEAQEELKRSLWEARARGASLQAQSRRLETLNRLSRELARHTDVRELADAVIELLREHFPFEAVLLSVARRGEVGVEVDRASGERRGPPDATHILRTSTGVVGRLDLWNPPADAGGESDSLLRDLLPWIALALDNARSFEALDEQAARLAEEIAERRRAEQQLESASRMDALGRLAGGLAHDFNNVLTAISGYAELANAGLGDRHPARADIDDILAVTQRASGLISQVLAFSSRQVLHPKRLDLNELIRGMESMLRSLVGESIELVVLPGPGLGAVLADAGRLEQVIVNLVANGRDAIGDGGRIEIETANVTVSARSGPVPPAVEPGRFVRLAVRDTGCGMDRETQSRIFEPFYTTKRAGEGTGLGLSTTYGTVTQSGGTIEVESEPGKGTQIAVLFPRAEGPADDAAPADEDVVGGSETVLLVEDDPAVRAATGRILRARGYTVLEAADGGGALEICASHAGPIQLVLTDVVMPGMDGRALVQRLLPERPDVRAVLYTSGYDSAKEKPVPVGRQHDFLRKPYTPAQLLAALRRLLES